MRRPAGGEGSIQAAEVIRFSAENKYLVIAIYAIVIVLAVGVIKRTPLDAIPDLSDTQVIVYSRWDRSPDILEDQVTYPIVTALLGAPKVKTIRGFSDFGFSYVYVIFEDGTDIYWARSRVLENLSTIQSRLPAGVKTELGPDATSVGWVYQYALVDESGKNATDDIRSYQDWFLRYAVQSVPGVAEVASVGGFQKQYQVTLDPNTLAAYGLPLESVVEAIRKSNNEIGGRLIEFSGREYMVRGRGYLKSVDDIGKIVVKTNEKGTPLTVGGHRTRVARARDPAGHLRPRRQGRRRGRHRRDAQRRERSRRHRAGEGPAEGDRAVAPPGREDRHDVRPVGPDQALHRHAPVEADRGDHRRLDRHPRLPLARSERDRPDRDDPDLRRPRVHPVQRDGPEHQHHVARRHRDLDRRPRGRRDRGGRERLQEAAAVERRRAGPGTSTRSASRRSWRSAPPSSSRSSSSPSRSCRSSRSWTRKGGSSSRSRTRRTSRWRSRRSSRSRSTRPSGCCSRGWTASRSARGGWPGSSTRSRWGSTTPRRSIRSASSSTGSTSGPAGPCSGIRRRRSRSRSSRCSPRSRSS